MNTPRTHYEAALASGSHQPDEAQQAAVHALDALHARLTTHVGATLWSRIIKRPVPVCGLYLHGGVGRGKTWLMDLFHDALPGVRKRRVHFHRFMREIHRALKALGEVRDPLVRVADDIAAEVDVLCFDELFVSDIGDAMILGTLFEALFARGITLVATSNFPPDALYRDGLQRARFLPAIAALKTHMQVVELAPGIDFRLRALEQAAMYHHPADEASESRLGEDFQRIAASPGVTGGVLELDGRPVPARRLADGVAWFDYAALCEGPRGAADYIELARTFHTVLVSRVPGMTAEMDDQARRFITLVDEFYDRNVKLILSAQVPLVALYSGDRLRFEFQRTTSRLQEMQSHDYLAQPHLG